MTATVFLFLLISTQFLPGGRRSFLDWLPAVAFLFAVSLAALAPPLAGGHWPEAMKFRLNSRLDAIVNQG